MAVARTQCLCIISVMGRFSGERRALAATILAFYGFIYFLLAVNPEIPDFAALFGSLAFMYGLSFFALVAGYFWARWYAIGLSISAMIMTGFLLFQAGIIGQFIFFGATHAAVAVLLVGKAMSASFDGRTDWRTRFHLDQAGTNRLGRAIIRATISLPFMVMYGLAPKGAMGLLGFAALGLAGAGLYGLIKLRTWGVIAMAGATATLVAAIAVDPFVAGSAHSLSSDVVGVVGIAAALGAIVPFAGPLFRYLKSDLA